MSEGTCGDVIIQVSDKTTRFIRENTTVRLENHDQTLSCQHYLSLSSLTGIINITLIINKI